MPETVETESTTKQTNKERLQAIVAGIEDGIQKLFQSDKYADYLRTMSRFHNYSVNNTVLIHLQKPNASLVAGFSQWKNKFSRHVKKGETGITIIAPTPFKKKVEEMKLDPDTNEPLYDADGKLIMEERTVEIPVFKPVKVFDLSQTEGKPLPQLVADLVGDVQQYEAFMEALRRSAPVPIEFQQLEPSMDGYYSESEQKIVLREGMSQVQTVCAAIHEIGHSMLHNREQLALSAAAGTDGKAPKPKDKNTMEIEAESLSYSVCAYYNIETSANSFGYIATWGKDKTVSELRASLETITKTANTLINSIDKNFAELCKERGIELAAKEGQTEKAAESPEVEQEDKDATVSEVAQENSEKPEKAEADTPERFAGDFCEYLDQLYKDGTIENPFSPLSKDALKPEIAGLMREGIFDGARDTLTEALNRTHSPIAAALVERLDKLVAQWEASLTYEVMDYPISTGEQNESSVTVFKPTDPEHLSGTILFVGPSSTCRKLAQELRDGTMTRAQAEAMRQQWEEAGAREAEVAGLSAQDALYLLDAEQYLQIRSSEAGIDYSLYHADTLRRIDGGQFPAENLLRHAARDPMEAACKEVCVLQGLDPDTVEAVPLEMLEQIEKANAITEPEFGAETVAKTVGPDTTLDEYPMPDNTMRNGELADYGYLDDDMLPLSADRALELLEQDFSIYTIVDGGEAELCFDTDDIEARPIDAMFAVPREEWEESAAFKEAVGGRMAHQEEREQAFLNHSADCFAIYQVKETDDLRFIRYESLEALEKQNQSPDKKNYDLVYTGVLSEGDTPDTLWERFNTDHPADYLHPSMSISDIVAMKRDGVVSSSYVDSFGFKEISDFFPRENYLKNAELATEDDANMIDGIINNGPKQPTVAELEAQVKAGQTITLMDLANAVHAEQREKKPERPVKAAEAALPEKQLAKKLKTAHRKSAER